MARMPKPPKKGVQMNTEETVDFDTASDVFDSEPGETIRAAAESTGKTRKTRTPIEERLAGMNLAERTVYYTKRVRVHEAAIKSLQELVGPEAVEFSKQ